MAITTIDAGTSTSSGVRLDTVVEAVMGIGLLVAFNARPAQPEFRGRRHDDADVDDETR